MTLAAWVPSREGMAVSVDRLTTHGGLRRKLRIAGGLAFVVSNDSEVIRRNGQVVFSVADTIKACAPERLELRDLPELARAVCEVAKKTWIVTQPYQGARIVFGQPRTIYTFTLENKDGVVTASSVSEQPIPLGRFQLQGMGDYVNEHVLRARRIDPRWYPIFCGPTPRRDITRRQALDFGRELVEVSEQTLKIIPHEEGGKIGGGVDQAIVRESGLELLDVPTPAVAAPVNPAPAPKPAPGGPCACASGRAFAECHGTLS